MGKITKRTGNPMSRLTGLPVPLSPFEKFAEGAGGPWFF